MGLPEVERSNPASRGPENSRRLVPQPDIDRSARSRGFLNLTKNVLCPSIAGELLGELQDNTSEFVTRHFDGDHLNSYRNGHFRFGTTASYGTGEASSKGRLSDLKEANLFETHRSKDGTYDNFFFANGPHDIRIRGVKFSGDIISVEYRANDFCACLSRGQFSEQRGRKIRAMGNPELSAFTTYDSKRLLPVLEELASADQYSEHCSILVRKVHYGLKDLHWEITPSFGVHPDSEALDRWLRIMFQKPNDFEHEDEVRFVLCDALKPGQLEENTQVRVFEDKRIADCIVDYGLF